MTVRPFILSAIAAAAAIVASTVLSRPGMTIGINATTLENYSFSAAFANLCLRMAPWRPFGTNIGTMSLSGQGLLTASVPTDNFYTSLDDTSTLVGSGQPAGTYTVLNPDGLMIAIGRSAAGTEWLSWTNATEVTFAYTTGAIVLQVQGSVTATTGALAVILPGHKDSWLAGNPFNTQFLSWVTGLGAKVLRTMDWTRTMDNYAVEWSERTVPVGVGAISLYNEFIGTGKPAVPWEYICKFTQLTGIESWVCVPVRTSSAYVTQMAALFAAQYPSGKQLHLEYGNEIWNYAQSFINNTGWVRYLNNTRYRSPISQVTSQVYQSGHGMTTGTNIMCFRDKSELGLSSAPADPLWIASGATICDVVVIDADNFKIRKKTDLQVLDFSTYPKSHLLWIKTDEPGMVVDTNINFSTQCLRNWDAFDSALGASRVVHIVSGQAADPSVAQGRLAVSGVSSRADCVATAPYFTGRWWGVSVLVESGAITPRIWTQVGLSQATTPLHVRVYPVAANPSTADVIAGIGAVAGYGPVTITPTLTDQYTAQPQITGLNTATSYKVIFAAQMDGTWWRLESAFTPASTSTLTLTDTYDNQLIRTMYSTTVVGAYTQANQALGKPVVFYECGNHSDEIAPAELAAWRNDFIQSSQFSTAISRYLKTMGQYGVKLACWFADVGRKDLASSVWTLAEKYADTSAARYGNIASLNGYFNQPSSTGAVDVAADSVQTQPGLLPYNVATIPGSGVTWSIYSGNESGAYGLSGNTLQIVDSSKITWDDPRSVTVRLLAVKGDVVSLSNVTFSTGNAWYPADATLAWESTTAADGASIAPKVGTLLALSGTATGPAVVGGGLLDMDGAAYSGESMTANLTPSKPVLIAVVLDKDNHTATYKTIARFGGGQNFRLEVNGNVNTDFRVFWSLSTGSGSIILPQKAAGKHVYWMYANGVDTVVVGTDEAEATPSTAVGLASAAVMAKTVNVGATTTTPMSAMKHGSMLVLNRTGLTLAEAKVMVAQMQTLHSIA